MPHPNAYELPRRHAVLARRVAAIVELRRGVQERCIVFSYQVARPEEIVGAIDITAKRNGEGAQAGHRRKDLVANRRIELHALSTFSPGLGHLDGERDRRDAVARPG